MNQPDATGAYVAMPLEEREQVCLRAIKNFPCGFCGVEKGTPCRISQLRHITSPTLDKFAHCNRWMNQIMTEANDISDML